MVKGLLNKHIGNEGVPNIHRKMSAMDTVTKQMTWEALLLYKQKGMYCSIAFTQSSRKPRQRGQLSAQDLHNMYEALGSSSSTKKI